MWQIFYEASRDWCPWKKKTTMGIEMDSFHYWNRKRTVFIKTAIVTIFISAGDCLLFQICQYISHGFGSERAPWAFRGLQEPSRSLPGPSMTFQDLQEPSGAFKGLPSVFQGLPGSSKSPIGAFQDLQGPSKSLPGPSRTRKSLPGPTGAFQGLPGPSRAFLKSSSAFQGPS